MEQAANRAIPAAVDHYFSSSTEHIFVPVCLRTPGRADDCFVMRPRPSEGSAIQMTQLFTARAIAITKQ